MHTFTVAKRQDEIFVVERCITSEEAARENLTILVSHTGRITGSFDFLSLIAKIAITCHEEGKKEKKDGKDTTDVETKTGLASS